MSFDADFDAEGERPRDRVIDAAAAVLMERFFPDDGKTVYYTRQLEIALEDQFFHWITSKAANELAARGIIASAEEDRGQYVARFFWPRRHRYPRRQIRAAVALIDEFSAPLFTRAVGAQGELLADSGFASVGFRIEGRNINAANGRRWTTTNHNLDRLISRDGVLYGVEVKNQLAYIDQTEFQVKLRMCKHLGIRPLFVARMMPRSYIENVRQAGGFSLILKNQNYPLMTEELARRVREELGFPAFVIRELPDRTMQRFERWHEANLPRVN